MKVKTKLPIPMGGGEAELEITKEEGSAIKRFFGAATPGFIKDRVGILNDNAQLARFKNFCKIVAEAEKVRKEYGLEPHVLPLKLGMRFIEDASLEDDKTIQTMWANLLANSDSGKTSAVSIYMSILKNLTSAEAKALNMFYSIIKGKLKHYGNDPSFFTLSRESVIKDLGKEFTDAEVIVEHLLKEGLIQYKDKRFNRLSAAFVALDTPNPWSLYNEPWEKDTKEQSESEKVIEYLKSTADTADKDSLQLTSLGFALVKVCNEPEDNLIQKLSVKNQSKV